MFGDVIEVAGMDGVDEEAFKGARSETSSMKLPAARFEGVRGRCRNREMS